MDWQLLDDTQETLRDLDRVGPNLTATTCTVAVLADHTDSLLARERLDVEAMATSRQHSFSTGRRCARHALDALGITHAGVTRDGRVPQWPPGVAGSITHSRRLAAAVATRVYAGIGIDLEQTGRVGEDLYDRLFVPEERERLSDDDATLMFSAKEAAYKATYPLAGKYIGFQEARVTLHDDGGFYMTYLGEHERSCIMSRGRGFWWRGTDHIVTLFVIEKG